MLSTRVLISHISHARLLRERISRWLALKTVLNLELRELQRIYTTFLCRGNCEIPGLSAQHALHHLVSYLDV